MSIPILIANILTLLAFVIHTFVVDKELKVNEPTNETDETFQKQEKWTMARCGWHWVSLDLLFASIGLALINLTDFFDKEKTLLQILAVYFFGLLSFGQLQFIFQNPLRKTFLNLDNGYFYS